MIIVYDYIINIDFYSKKLYNISTITIKQKCKEMNGNGNFLVNNNSNREALIGVETGQNEESYTPKMVSLDPETYRDRYPKELSGGQ